MKSNLDSKENSSVTRILNIILGGPWFELIGDLWLLGKKIIRGLSNEGMYEVLEYETKVEIHDKKGEKATVYKHQKVRYLQDNIIAYQDQAWGDGEILLDYKCTPGEPADHYQSGHKEIILISLREIKHKNDVDEFHIQWGIKDGFLNESEAWVADIDHKTKHLKLTIILPENRAPHKASIHEGNRKRTDEITEEGIVQLPDGRWQISWETDKPRLYENYILKWEW